MKRTRNNFLADGEFWVDAQDWIAIRQRIADAGDDLHRVARAPRSPGAIKVSATVALFEMEGVVNPLRVPRLPFPGRRPRVTCWATRWRRSRWRSPCST